MSQLNSPYSSETNLEPIRDIRNWQPHPILAMIACLAAAGLCFLIVEQVYPVVPREDLPEQGAYPSPELVARYNAAEIAFQSANGAINGAILGALLGLLIGALTTAKKPLGALIGAIAGAGAGAGGGYVAGILVAGAINRAGAQSTIQSIGFLAILWGVIAATICGVMAAIHNPKQTPVAFIVGLVIAAVAAVVYNVVASLIYPMSNLVLLTPNSWGERLVWALCFGLVLGLGIAFGFRPQPAKAAEPSSDIA